LLLAQEVRRFPFFSFQQLRTKIVRVRFLHRPTLFWSPLFCSNAQTSLGFTSAGDPEIALYSRGPFSVWESFFSLFFPLLHPAGGELFRGPADFFLLKLSAGRTRLPSVLAQLLALPRSISPFRGVAPEVPALPSSFGCLPEATTAHLSIPFFPARNLEPPRSVGSFFPPGPPSN